VVPPSRAQLDAQDNWAYSVPRVLRGVTTSNTFYCFEDVGIVPTTSPDAIVWQLDNLTKEEASPTPVVISGW
jgi:hypothetical protein